MALTSDHMRDMRFQDLAQAIDKRLADDALATAPDGTRLSWAAWEVIHYLIPKGVSSSVLEDEVAVESMIKGRSERGLTAKAVGFARAVVDMTLAAEHAKSHAKSLDPPASEPKAIKRKRDGPAPAPKAHHQALAPPKKVTKLLPEVVLAKEALDFTSQPFEFQLVERTQGYSADAVDFTGSEGYTRKILVVHADTYGEALDVASGEGYERCSCNGCCNVLPEEDWDFCGQHYECCRCGDAVDIDGEDYCSDCLHVMP